MWQIYIKQDDKIVSAGTHLSKWQFYFQDHLIVNFFLVYNITILLYTLAELGYVLKCQTKEKSRNVR